jgi:Xaa-Pro aminopeptidase
MGDVLITDKFAGLWTDSRYFLQAEQELDPQAFTLMKLGEPETPTLFEYVSQTLKEGQTFASDARLFSLNQEKQLRPQLHKKKIQCRFTSENLVDQIWPNQPAIPSSSILCLDEKFSGESFLSKVQRIRSKMNEEGVYAYILSALDSIAWLFNIRGSDVPFNPVLISYALLTQDDIFFFRSPLETNKDLKQHFKDQVQFKAYEDLPQFLAQLQEKQKKVWVDPQRTSLWLHQQMDSTQVHQAEGPEILFKALKNKVEQEGMRKAHQRDGVALCKFFAWLEKHLSSQTLTEASAAEKLLAFRQEHPYFKGPSFETISGYQHHGAIVHYRVSPESDIPLKAEGLFLLDSGGQYLDGTTDVTRTIALGSPTPQQKEHFTRVLKGHIALDTICFPQGTCGVQLDILARKALWDVGLNYGHGTGHGVGCFLNVHEGPQGISTKSYVPLQAGMVVSNEPGFYLNGAYGIRIENLVIVQPAPFEKFLRFEALTLCPLDKKLIETSLLTPQEIQWVNRYHSHVYKKIAPDLQEAEKQWLAQATSPVV